MLQSEVFEPDAADAIESQIFTSASRLDNLRRAVFFNQLENPSGDPVEPSPLLDVITAELSLLPPPLLRLAVTGNRTVPLLAREEFGLNHDSMPEKLALVLNYAFSRDANVRRHAGNLVLSLFEIDHDQSLPYVYQAVDDQANRYSNRYLTGQLVLKKPELFDIDSTEPAETSARNPNEWRSLLEVELLRDNKTSIRVAASLYETEPDMAISILVLADNLEEARRLRDGEVLSVPSSVLRFLIASFNSKPSEREDGINLKDCFYRIKNNPQAMAFLERDIKIAADEDDPRSLRAYANQLRVLCAMLPEFEQFITSYFKGQPRRISDASIEYITDRREARAKVEPIDVFGYDPSEKSSAATITTETELEEYKKQILAIPDSEDISLRVRRKIKQLKGLFESGATSETKIAKFNEFLTSHVNEQLIEYQRSLDAVPGWQASFIRTLPKEIDRETAIRRIRETEVAFYDELASLARLGETNAYGFFYEGLSRVTIKLIPGGLPRLEKTYIHEMWHVVSGRSLIVMPPTYDRKAQIVTEKLGLQMLGFTKDTNTGLLTPGPPRFTWANEARTEAKTIKTSRQDSDIYVPERIVEHAIRTMGEFVIPEAVFNAAYLENVYPDKPSSVKMLNWLKLNKLVDKAHRTQDKLLQVDRVVEACGIEDAEKKIVESLSRKKRKK